MQIRIKQYTFSVSEPYTEGTVLTRGEAQALNALRAENIQDGTRRAVNEALAVVPPGGLLSPAELARLQEVITKFDLAYQFREVHQAKARRGVLEAEVRRVAEEIVESQMRADGIELGEEALELAISETERTPRVQEEARRRVAERQAIAARGLEELL